MNRHFHPSTSITPAGKPATYSTYRSPYGPKYTINPNIAGFTPLRAKRLVLTLGAFGGVAGFFALFFFGDVPRVRKDIYEKIPLFGQYFEKKIPPSDNVSLDITYLPPTLVFQSSLVTVPSIDRFYDIIQ
ncbi:QCR10 domain-containing protein [Golovinomyces cichoracearum]|uniref:QCR10 domain-containing protein n=1 Tax=Golovinomyces cichoracearum TaxID=62708 RepID=A0A420I999_9PEZI|nr:QCR10 domain-containing protein [Golovinomyces cichoracearum]